jgi:hypothetical protein
VPVLSDVLVSTALLELKMDDTDVAAEFVAYEIDDTVAFIRSNVLPNDWLAVDE